MSTEKNLLRIKINKTTLVTAVLILNTSLSFAASNFLSLRTREEVLQNTVLNAVSGKRNIFINGNISRNFSSILDDITSDDENRIAERVSNLIGQPLRSSASLGFSFPLAYEIGYFYSHELFALTQNPTFPNVDASIDITHNLWLKKEWKPVKNLNILFFPILGLQKSVSETKELGEIIDDGIELETKNEDFKAFASLNLNFEYSFELFDIGLENYNYFLGEGDRYSSFLTLKSYADFSSISLYSFGRYRVVQAFSIIEEKKIDLAAGLIISHAIDFSLTLNELKFINPRIAVNYKGVHFSFAYTKASLDILQNQVSENYNFTTQFSF